MPLPRRWLTALMTRYNGSSLMIDCGEGTQVAIKEKGWSFKPIDVICFTHYHGDHISGLPGLLLTMGNADRTEPLTLVGPRGLERVVNALQSLFCPLYNKGCQVHLPLRLSVWKDETVQKKMVPQAYLQ